MKRGATLALLFAVPLLLGAKDPRGDVTDCATGQPVHGPDLVAARGTATELKTVGEWLLRFDRPVEVPSDLRIDVLVRDPRLPPESLGDEVGMNRIVRWEATSSDRPLEIIWLPHDGSTSFNPPVVNGRNVALIAPGRLLLGESANGVESVERARWSVIVRAGGACDRLGDGVPVHRLIAVPAASATPAPSPVVTAGPEAGPSPSQPSTLRVPWALLLIVPVAVGIWLYRRGSNSDRSSSGAGRTKLSNGHG
jgi:hypothetical protein